MVSLNLLPPSYLTALLVEDVLASYPLNPHRADRIRNLAVRRFREKPDLETIYLFIDSLVEGGVRPEDFLLSLASSGPLPAPSPEPARILEEKERGEPLTYAGIAETVRSRLGEEPARILVDVLERARVSPETQSPVTRAELEENLGAVSRNLSRIRERLERCGILAPSRRIGRVSFERENLFEIRGGYDSRVTDAVAVRIFEAHRLGLSQTEAGAFAGVARDTVKRWWRSAGLKPHCRAHNALPPETLGKISKAHARYKGNAFTASKALGVAPSTVIRHWRAAGLSPRGRPRALSPEEKDRILNAHASFHGNAASASRALGPAPSTIRKYWKRAGLSPRRPGRPPHVAEP